MAGPTIAGAGGGVSAQPTTKAARRPTSASAPPRREIPTDAPLIIAAIQGIPADAFRTM
jgi:hypothetical protein